MANYMFWYKRFYFFFNDTATTEIYTLSLHDALPISPAAGDRRGRDQRREVDRGGGARTEEHTTELQSQSKLVCRLQPAKTSVPQPRTQDGKLLDPYRMLSAADRAALQTELWLRDKAE